MVHMADFERALKEIKPAFGVDNNELSNSIRGGIIEHGSRFSQVSKSCMDFIEEIRQSKTTQLLTVLLEGEYGCGKTALSASLALKSEFPFVKLISPESFVGYSESGKIS